MSEDKTAEMNDPRTFEERVFARFDTIDARFDGVEGRLDRVESRLDGVVSRLEGVESRLDGVESRLEGVESRLDGVESRLEGVESGLSSVNARVEKLEMKQYDTRPIWEQAMAAIAETNSRMDQGFELLRTEMKSEFATLRKEIDHSLQGVERKIDALNHNILQVQADQRYNDRRLQEVESQVKPT